MLSSSGGKEGLHILARGVPLASPHAKRIPTPWCPLSLHAAKPKSPPLKFSSAEQESRAVPEKMAELSHFHASVHLM